MTAYGGGFLFISPDGKLYGITLGANLAVIYAPHGLSCGWELAQCPYCWGIGSQDALALGVNVLSYAVMR